MQALTELIAGVIAMLAAAALSQFGVDLTQPTHTDREVHRVNDCGDRKAPSAMVASRPSDRC